MSFHQLGLHTDLLPTLERLGFTTPTPVQTEAIPFAMKDEQDLVVVARTGTGKTAAFGLPLLSLIEPQHEPQALILSPTRELANQITEELKRFSKAQPQMKIMSVFGGAPIEGQIRQIRKGVSIIVATPGRLLDLARRKVFKADLIKYLVLDEADEMLNMGFKEELDNILDLLPKERRTWLYSATMARSVKRIAERFMQKPHELRIEAGKDEGGRSQGKIEHIAYNLPRGKKYEALLRLIDATENLYAMIFCRTRLETQSLVDRLMSDGIEAGALHGDLSQALRDQVMKRFKDKNLHLLIATDIAARGIDVDELSHVIHYDLPENAEAYIHRSGRTGRAGADGISALFVEPRDQRRTERLARSVRLHIKVHPLPKPHDVIKRRLKNWVKELLTVDVPAELPQWFAELPEEIAIIRELDREELIQLACAQALAQTLHQQRLEDLNDNLRGNRSRDQHRSERGGLAGQHRREKGSNERRGRESRGDRERNTSKREVQQSNRSRSERQNDRTRYAEKRVASPSKSGEQEHSNKGKWAVVEVNRGLEGGLSEQILKQKLKQGGLNLRQLGRLQVLDQVCIFEVQERGADQALKSFKGYKIDGQKVRARRRS